MTLWIMALILLINTFTICILFFLVKQITKRYIKLEEWAEDWLKRLEQKVEAADIKATGTQDFLMDAWNKIHDLEEMLPKDGNNEVLRHNVLLQQMNDEMERSLRMEREWNDGIYSIMNYGKPQTEVNET